MGIALPIENARARRSSPDEQKHITGTRAGGIAQRERNY
jgi:hypothetical protein